MRTQRFHLPHFAMPHFGHRSADPDAHHHHRHAYQRLNRVEGAIDLMVVALIVAFALAIIYGLMTAGAAPSYFDRWPG